MPSVGQAEQERAFQAALDGLGPSKERRIVHAILPVGDLREQLRAIFDAGVERGQELRGCCQEVVVEMDEDSDPRKLLERHPLP